MLDTLNQVNWLKVGLILAALLIAAFAALYVFNVPFNTLVWVTLIGGFAWMHMGMHGGHGGHGGHGVSSKNAARDEPAGHTVDDGRSDAAKTIATDSNARRAVNAQVKAAAPEESRGHRGC